MTLKQSLAVKLVVVAGGFCLAWFVAGSCAAQDGGGSGLQPAMISVERPDSATASAATISKVASVTDPSASTTVPPSMVQRAVIEIKATAEDLKRLTAAERRKWDTAVASFPGFCSEWNRMLHDREINNLSNLQWQEKSGYETASYTGYGNVEGCLAKESAEGVPIGKVTYDEIKYYLTGKSIDEAKTHPQQVGKTQTLEIFSFEKDRWFY